MPSVGRLFLALAVSFWAPSPRREGARAAGPEAASPTVTLRGRVDFKREPGGVGSRPGIGELGMPSPHDAPDRRQAVVYLEAAPRGAFEEREGGRATLDQRHQNFIPHVLAITTGTTVEFRNNDKTYHNVFSLSKPKSFDLGRYAVGQTKSVRFDRPGVVRVFCEIHSHMSAFILIFAHRFFSVTNADGDYRIEGLPPGNYSVAVWHPVLSADPKLIRIPEGGGEVDLDFSLS